MLFPDYSLTGRDVAGRSPAAFASGADGKRHAACSALHFEPVSGDVQWRVVYNVTQFGEGTFPLILGKEEQYGLEMGKKIDAHVHLLPQENLSWQEGERKQADVRLHAKLMEQHLFPVVLLLLPISSGLS